MHGSVWFCLGYGVCRLANYDWSTLLVLEEEARRGLLAAVLGPSLFWLLGILLPLSVLAWHESVQPYENETDDATYFEVLTNDILHLQQRLGALAHGTERAGRRLLSAGASYTEGDLIALRDANEPSAAKVELHEILADKQMLLERSILQVTARSGGSRRLDEVSEHVAPSLSRLPYFYALIDRVQNLFDLQQAQQPAKPAAAAAVPAVAAPASTSSAPPPAAAPARGAAATPAAAATAATPAAATAAAMAARAALAAEVADLERQCAALGHCRHAEQEARRESAQLRAQLGASEARAAAARAEAEAARAHAAQAVARERQAAEAAARGASEAEEHAAALRAERDAAAARERQAAEAAAAAAAAEAGDAAALEARAAAAAREEAAAREAAAAGAAAALADEVARLGAELGGARAELAAQREAAARAHEAAARAQARLGAAEGGARAARQQAEEAERLAAALAEETRARECAEREAETSARALQLWTEQQGNADSFEAVLADEMASMRVAFEAQLQAVQRQLATQVADSRREVRALQERHDLEVRAAEARGRQERL